MRYFMLILGLSLGATSAVHAQAPVDVAAKPKAVVFPLFAETPPGETGKIDAEVDQPQKPGQNVVRRITNVTKPELHLFAVKDAKTAVVIAPGGGYNILAWDLEGEEVAAWLNSIGVTAAVLKYRVPRRPDDAKDQAPVVAKIDALRAMRLMRSKMPEGAKVGMLGFSAGGHLTATTCTNYDADLYKKTDDADKLTARPDFAILVYPAYLLDLKDPTKIRPELPINDKTPPMFFAHAFNDQYSIEGSLQFAIALKKAKVPCEVHVYSTGGHGFGLRPSKSPSHTWPTACAAWLKASGMN